MDFSKLVIAGLSRLWELTFVSKVEVPGDLPKAASGYSITDGSVPEIFIPPPVVVQRWELNQAHQYTEALVC